MNCLVCREPMLVVECGEDGEPVSHFCMRCGKEVRSI